MISWNSEFIFIIWKLCIVYLVPQIFKKVYIKPLAPTVLCDISSFLFSWFVAWNLIFVVEVPNVSGPINLKSLLIFTISRVG